MQMPKSERDYEAQLIAQGIDPAMAAQLARSAMWKTKYGKTEQDIARGQGPMGGMVGSGKYQHYVMDPSQLINRYQAGAGMRSQPELIREGEQMAEAYARMLMGDEAEGPPSQAATVEALRGGGAGGMQQPNVGQPEQMPPPMPPQGGGPGMMPPQGGGPGMMPPPGAQAMPAMPPPSFQGTPLGPNGQPMTPQMLEQLKQTNPMAYQAIMSRMGG